MRNRRTNESGIADRGQRYEDDTTRKSVVQPTGQCDSQSCLAHAAGTSQRQQPDLVVLQCRSKRREFRLTADEPC